MFTIINDMLHVLTSLHFLAQILMRWILEATWLLQGFQSKQLHTKGFYEKIKSSTAIGKTNNTKIGLLVLSQNISNLLTLQECLSLQSLRLSLTIFELLCSLDTLQRDAGQIYNHKWYVCSLYLDMLYSLSKNKCMYTRLSNLVINEVRFCILCMTYKFNIFSWI